LFASPALELRLLGCCPDDPARLRSQIRRPRQRCCQSADPYRSWRSASSSQDARQQRELTRAIIETIDEASVQAVEALQATGANYSSIILQAALRFNMALTSGWLHLGMIRSGLMSHYDGTFKGDPGEAAKQ
jgi:hypothetical protein